MAKKLEVYKCEICGNIVEVVEGGDGQLVCCNQPMKLMDEQTADSSTEKHVPIVENNDSGVKVVVGSTIHPMEEKHYIQWIEVIANGKVYKEFLNPGDSPEAVFPVKKDDITSVREYCSIHGLWRNDKI